MASNVDILTINGATNAIVPSSEIASLNLGGSATQNVNVLTQGVNRMTLDSAGATINGSISASNLTPFRNKLINGDMRLDQRNAGSAVTVGPDMGYVPVVSLNSGMSGSGWANTSNRPTFDTTNNAVTFNRASSQYLDAGSKTLNMATNGFTCTTVVMFTGTITGNERIFDFGGGAPSSNILFLRNATDIFFSVYNGTSVGFGLQAPNTIPQNSLAYISMSISSAGVLTLYVNGIQVATDTNTSVVSNRTLPNTYIGRSHWSNDPYLNGTIYFLSAYDACFSTAEVSTQYSILSNLFNRANTIPYSIPQTGPTLPNPVISVTPATYNSINWVQPAAQSPYVDRANRLIRFERAKSHYLDLGSRTLTIADTGFTATAVVMFNGVPAEFERLFMFDNGSNLNDIINIGRTGTSLVFGCANGGSDSFTFATNAVTQNTLHFFTFVISTTGVYTVYSNGVQIHTATFSTRNNRTVARTTIGAPGPATGQPHTNMNLYYFAAYNSTFSATQVAQQHQHLQTTLFSNLPTSSPLANNAIHPVAPTLQLTPLMASYPWAANSATFDTTNNVVTFNRASSQFIDAGSRTFNMATNGFTVTAVVMFTGIAGSFERIIDFGNGQLNNNILFARSSTSNLVYIQYLSGATALSSVHVGCEQNTLYVFTGTISSAGVLTLYTNGSQTATVTASPAPTSRTVTTTYIGRSQWTGDAYSSMNLYFLAAYDATFTPTQVLNQYNALSALIRPLPLYQTPALDRMVVYHDTQAGSGAFIVQRDVDAPIGFSNSLSITNVSGPHTAGFGGISQRIEGQMIYDLDYDTSLVPGVTHTPQPIAVSFWCKSSVPGTYMVSVANALVTENASQAYHASFTVSATNIWEYKTFVIPAPTAGVAYWDTNGSNYGMRVTIHLAGAATVFNNGTSALAQWQTAGYERNANATSFTSVPNAVFKVTGWQLEKGTLVTPYEVRGSNFENTLNAVVSAQTKVHEMPVDTSGYGNLVLAGNISAGNLGMFRNRIINGDMRIDQRNNGAAVVASPNIPGYAYVVDRFQVQTINYSSGSMTFARDTDVPLGTGFRYSISATATTAMLPSGGNHFTLPVWQKIEGNNVSDLYLGTSRASPFTVSFWIKTSIPGSYAVFARGVGNVSYGTLVRTTTSDWEYKTIVFPPSPITGTVSSDHNQAFELAIGCVAGASYNTNNVDIWAGSAGVGITGSTFWIGTSGAFVKVTGLQLEKGSIATPFDFRPYGIELQLCQRYFECVPDISSSSLYTQIGIMSAINTSQLRVYLPFKVSKRSNDYTVSQIGNMKNDTSNTSVVNIDSGVTNAAPPSNHFRDYGYCCVVLTPSGWTPSATASYLLARNNDGTARFTFNAEFA